MRKLIIVGALLGVLAMMATMAFGAATSSAAEWLCNLEAIKCEVNSLNLEPMLLEDMGVPAAVECPAETVESTGTVGTGAADETKTVTFGTTCKPAATATNLKGELVENQCLTVDTLTALDLPWKTEGVDEGAEKWDLIKSGTGGTPGYLIECVTVLGLVDDSCVSSTEANSVLVLLENLKAEGSEPTLVTVKFNKKLLAAAEAAKCTFGAEDGLVIGEQLLEALIGGVAKSLEFD
jgi:hypothetical protein